MKSKQLWLIPKIWDDCECFIIGGGYSLIYQFNLPFHLAPTTKEEYVKFGDLIKPYFIGKKVIGVNNAFMLGDWVDVAFWGDSAQYFNYKNQYDSFSGLKVTCHPKYENDPIPGVKYIKRSKEKRTGLTSKRKFVVWNYNSGACSINLARHLGANKIYLLGFDMYTDPKYNRTHWHSGYPNKRNTPTVKDKKRGNKETIREPKKVVKPPYDRHMRGFKDIADQAINLGVQIINFNPDSRIDVFQKENLFSYFGQGK